MLVLIHANLYELTSDIILIIFGIYIQYLEFWKSGKIEQREHNIVALFVYGDAKMVIQKNKTLNKKYIKNCIAHIILLSKLTPSGLSNLTVCHRN